MHNSKALRRVLACGVRFGKSTAAAMEGLAAAMEFRRSVVRGWIVAPTYDLSDKVFREIKAIVLEKLKGRVIKISDSEKLVVLSNMAGYESEIKAKSADNPTSLLGEGLDWLIVDEAARIKREVWESHLTQRLLDKRGWALLISTPRGKGWFFDAWRRGKDPGGDATTAVDHRMRGYESWNMPTWVNPHVSKELIELERSRIPERVFAQEYGAEFIEGAGQVFRNVRSCATGEWLDPDKDELYYGGLDLAKTEDYTVLVLIAATTGQVAFVDRFHRLDWDLQVERVKAAVDRYENVLVSVDSTGMGEPVYEQLRSAGIVCRAYPFSAKSKKDMINNLSVLLEKGKLVLPRPELWPIGIDELEAYEYSITPTGHMRMEAPSGLHDDCVSALGLAALKLRAGAIPTLTVL